MSNTLLLRRILTVAAVCVVLNSASPAVAAERADPEQTTSANTLAVGTASVSIADIIYTPEQPATPRHLVLPDDVDVTVWKLDQASEFYDDVTADTTHGKTAAGEWFIGSLSAGTYAFRFDATDPSIGSQYFNASPYWGQSSDVVLTDGATTPLGTITLTPRAIETWRISGANRYATAAETSRSSISDGASPDVVYLASGTHFPDALAAGPAAIHAGGLLLLTAPNSIPAATKERLLELTPPRVVILGGLNSISAAVQNEVQTILPAATVERLAGANRFLTAEAIVRDSFDVGATDVAFIVSGRNFPDALSAGAAAGYIGAPVILVDGLSSALSPATRALLSDLGVETALIAGGPKSVSTGIEDELISRLGDDNVQRYAGANRYETAAAINSGTFYRPDYGVLTSGETFPDALAGAVYAASLGAPLHLTRGACLSTPANDTVWDQRSNGVVILGGTAALSQAVEDLEPCP
jgi:putative cell wall-binding protein